MYYDDKVIEEVRARNDIVDVIGGYVSLSHKGNSYKCCCPFHHEKTPSFIVNRDTQLYHCFGCHKGGTVYTFIMEYENMTFPETIKLLAERVGYALPEVDMSKEERAKENYRVKLRAANRSAAAFYHYVLTETQQAELARQYFEKRGLTRDIIDAFGLGYADKYGNSLRAYLNAKGFDDNTLKDAGLIDISENKGATDVFWNRVIIPIADINGKVIAFGGRVLGDGMPKYLNTRDTLIFNKRHNLFAMNIAKKSKRRGIIVCEGYMDVIAMHQAGFDNAVASLGTAFTYNQANLIKRFTDEVYLAYDSDDAGTKASLKNIALLRQVGIYARVIDMKPHKDPDEFIRALGKDAYEDRINNSVTGIEFELMHKAKAYNMRIPEEKGKFANEVAKTLSELPDPVTRQGYIDLVADTYGIDKHELKMKVSKYGELIMEAAPTDFEDEEDRQPKTVATQSRDDVKHEGERLLLTWLVKNPSLFSKLEGIIEEKDFLDEDYRRIVSIMLEQYKDTGQIYPAQIINMFDDVDKQTLVGNALQTELPFETSLEEKEKALNEVVRKLKLERIAYEMEHAGNDVDKISELMNERTRVCKMHISIR